ncbi:MAG: hypothetical protein ACYSX0_06380 [Planctomycetota bacterium]|jgi:hypothetical protein
MRTGIAALCCAAVLCGCAGYEVVRLRGMQETEKDEATNGVRFYRHDLYFLVTATVIQKMKGKEPVKEVKLSVDKLWLPDRDEEYGVKTLGDFKFALSEGWNLKAIEADVDTASVAGKLLEVLEAGISKGAILAAGREVPPSQVVAYLFKLQWTKEGYRIQPVDRALPLISFAEPEGAPS